MILPRCPVCKADNTPSPCRRCKADLSLLVALEQQRQAALARAKDSLATGDWAFARDDALEADHLRRDDESLRLLGVTSLLCGDHAGACQCYQELMELSE